MYFPSIQAALAMDGHGPYVWSAYLLTLFILALLLHTPGRQQRRLLRELNARQRRSARGPAAQTEGV